MTSSERNLAGPRLAGGVLPMVTLGFQISASVTMAIFSGKSDEVAFEIGTEGVGYPRPTTTGPPDTSPGQ
jgi:hypothetical protein